MAVGSNMVLSGSPYLESSWSETPPDPYLLLKSVHSF